MRLPPWLDIGMIVIGVGALLILVGFLFGDAAAGQFGTGGSLTTYQSDLEFFFVLTGVGILFTIGGWMLRVIMPLRRSGKAAALAYAATSVAYPPTTATPPLMAPSPPQMAPVSAPAAPLCASCGKPTTFIAQYGRYYCYACGRYV